eukprot:COSAG02_NODE_7693_length_2890_cov_25.324189_3_plen_82_part_00
MHEEGATFDDVTSGKRSFYPGANKFMLSACAKLVASLAVGHQISKVRGHFQRAHGPPSQPGGGGVTVMLPNAKYNESIALE